MTLPARLGSISAALLAAVALSACGQKASPPPPPTPVSVGPVRRQPVPLELQATGTVEPLQTVAIEPQVTGPITRIYFSEGAEVKEGQPLFQIDPRPFQAALQQAEAELRRDRAMAANAVEDAKRYAELASKEYVTAQQYGQAKTSAAAAEATAAASEAAVEQARLNLQYARIRAPIAGRTGNLMVREGNLVRASQSTPLVTINQLRPILVRFAVPAENLPAIRRFRDRGAVPVTVVPTGAGDTAAGAPAGLGLAGDAAGSLDGPASPAPSGGASEGTLTFLNNAVDTTTGTILLKGTFRNSDGALWPGEFVNVRLRLAIDTALTVPAAAVVSGQQGTYVFVVQGDGTVAQRPVAVDRTQGDLAVVRGDLQAGQRVVTDGQLRLRPGAKVQIKQAEQASP